MIDFKFFYNYVNLYTTRDKVITGGKGSYEIFIKYRKYKDVNFNRIH